MLHHSFWAVVALVGLYTIAAAQQRQPFSGTWNGRSTLGANDSVLIIFVLTIAPDGKSATMKVANKNLIPIRVLAVGGDSMVTEAGPYRSIVRPWESVKSLRTTAHLKGDTLKGITEVRYESGELVKARTEATRVVK